MKYLLRFALLAMAVGLPTWAQPGSGKPYGTRDPKTCTSRKEPTNGAPSAAQAVTYFNCTMESFFGDKLTLVENVKIEVGNGRRFLRSDSELKEIDPNTSSIPSAAPSTTTSVAGGPSPARAIPTRLSPIVY